MREPLVPIECTPPISRHAFPAIFWTTLSATEICPSPVASRSPGGGTATVLAFAGFCSPAAGTDCLVVLGAVGWVI
jgi:hypothetical protein